MKNCPICNSKPKLNKNDPLYLYARELSPSFNYNCFRCQFITLKFNHTVEQAVEDWNKAVDIYLKDKENSKEKNMMQINEKWALDIESKLQILMSEIENIKTMFCETEPFTKESRIGKWGFVSDTNFECPDNGHLRKLVSVNKFSSVPYRVGSVSYKYFRPATYEELNG